MLKIIWKSKLEIFYKRIKNLRNFTKPDVFIYLFLCIRGKIYIEMLNLIFFIFFWFYLLSSNTNFINIIMINRIN